MFKKQEFAEAIERIQGDRTLNGYARDCGVSAAYISKLKRCLVDKAPSPGIIYKLADRKVDAPSYADLMILAGHILPLEENDKMRAKKFYLMKDNPVYTALHPDLEERYSSLTEEERAELDDFKEQSTPEELMEFITTLGNFEDLSILVQGEEEASAIKEATNVYELNPRTVRIPILGKISCGDPIDAIENIEGYMWKRPEDVRGGDYYGLIADGMSMHPTIPDGAEVTIKAQPEAENGQIVAALVNGDQQVTLKRFRRSGNTVLLAPDNPEYETIVIDEENPAKIIGVVTGFEMKFNY